MMRSAPDVADASKAMLTNPRLLWTLIFALVLGSLTMAYLWIDRSLSLSYANASIQATAEAHTQAILLIAHEWKGQTAGEVFAKLQQIKEQTKDADTLLKREALEGVIWFGHLRFKFNNDRLSEIR